MKRNVSILTIGVFGFFFFLPDLEENRVRAQTSYPVTTSFQGSGSSDQDDMAIWVHPSNPEQSTVVASDKAANKIFVYNMDGSVVQSFATGQPGNLDIRYNFPFNGQLVDIIGYNDRGGGIIRIYKVNADRTLTRIDNNNIKTSFTNYGFTFYKSPTSGKMYGVTSQEGGSSIEQFEFKDVGGQVTGTSVRKWSTGGGQSEGMVADDATSTLFVGQETAGIWKLGAEPTAAAPGTKVITTAQVPSDIEGLTIYHAGNSGGYLMASSQGTSTFRVFDKNAPHTARGTFKVAGASSTDGIDVSNVNLGPNFPQGIFLAHSGSTAIRGVKWNTIATGLSLSIDTSWDPRGGASITQPPITVTNTPAQTVTITQTQIPGDANNDHKVDGVDFVIWLSHYGQTVSGGVSVGDFNQDAKVDGIDYAVWLNNYGR